MRGVVWGATRVAGVVSGALLMVALSGCAVGAAGASDTPSADGSAAGEALATEEATIDPGVALPDPGTADTCLLGTWSADLPNLAEQMEADLYSDAMLGVLAAEVTVDGETLWVFEADHTFTWGGPATFHTYVADEIGTEFQVEMDYSGQVTGRWRYNDPAESTIVIDQLDTSLQTTTPTVTVNGVTLADAHAFDGLTDAAPRPGVVEISCATGLLTRPEGSPLTTQWERVR